MLSARVLLPVLLGLAAFLIYACPFAAPAAVDLTEKAKKFITAHESKFRPLEVAASIAWWEAMTTGNKDAFKKKEEAQNKMDEALSNPAVFKELKALYQERKDVGDAVTARAIEVLYLMYLEKQVDPALLKKITAKENAVDQKFTIFRAKVDDKEMADSEVRKVLKESKDSARRQAVWEAAKQVGGVLEGDLKELVKLRNQAAVQLGYKNYHQLKLALNEQTTEDILKLFDELDDLTKEPFKTAKAEIDGWRHPRLARQGLPAGELVATPTDSHPWA